KSPTLRPLQRRMRRGAAQTEQSMAKVSLMRVDGVLRWKYEGPQRSGNRRRAARRAARVANGVEIHSFPVRELAPGLLRRALEALDDKLTPARGLRRLVVKDAEKKNPDLKLEDVDSPFRGSGDKSERTLLLVHGTFSKGDMYVDELTSTARGRAFLKTAAARYDHILTFDHPTVAVSPVLNAQDLQRAMAGYEGIVDVVCHSRGGLVVAWWLRSAASNVRRVIFVASTLAGTSLADPGRLAD